MLLNAVRATDVESFGFIQEQSVLIKALQQLTPAKELKFYKFVLNIQTREIEMWQSHEQYHKEVAQRAWGTQDKSIVRGGFFNASVNGKLNIELFDRSDDFGPDHALAKEILESLFAKLGIQADVSIVF